MRRPSAARLTVLIAHAELELFGLCILNTVVLILVVKEVVFCTVRFEDFYMAVQEVDLELLINLVQQRPVLWDKTLDVYKDRNKTRDGWQDICTILVHDYEEKSATEKKLLCDSILKKWKNMRDAWLKFCKKEADAKKSGASACKTKKYIFHEQMQFLKKTIQHRPSDDSLELGEDAADEGGADTNITNKNTENTLHVVINDTPRTSATSTPQQKRKKQKLDEFELKMLSAIEKNKSEDSTQMGVFQGIMPAVCKLNEEQFIEFQMGVLQVLKNIKSQNVRHFNQIPNPDFPPQHYPTYTPYAVPHQYHLLQPPQQPQISQQPVTPQIHLLQPPQQPQLSQQPQSPQIQQEQLTFQGYKPNVQPRSNAFNAVMAFAEDQNTSISNVASPTDSHCTAASASSDLSIDDFWKSG